MIKGKLVITLFFSLTAVAIAKNDKDIINVNDGSINLKDMQSNLEYISENDELIRKIQTAKLKLELASVSGELLSSENVLESDANKGSITFDSNSESRPMAVLEITGRYSDPTAHILYGNNTFSVRKSDVIDGKFLIEKINEQLVVVKNIHSNKLNYLYPIAQSEIFSVDKK